MVYVRLSSLSSVMVQVPGSRAVWTSSFNAVKRVPSCSVTAFSIGSCWPVVWVASPKHQGRNITDVLVPFPERDASLPLSSQLSPLIQLSISERLLTRTRFVRCCLAFLSGNQPVHFIEHSVNLRQDQQLGQDIKSENEDGEHTAQTDSETDVEANQKLHSLLLWLQSSC